MSPARLLSAGDQVADSAAASSLLACLPMCRILHADKCYDTNYIRRVLEAKGTAPNIPAEGEPDIEELLLGLPLP